MDENPSAFWEQHARHDPLWAVLSDPSKRGRQWELSTFFETGRREISLLLQRIQDVGVVLHWQRALDFGCGVGRLTSALGRHFETAIGVDISPTMVQLAERLNRRPERVSYVLNARDDLQTFSSDHFDLVYTDIVLQHIRPDAVLTYLREFLRVLRPGGLLVFQLPSNPREAGTTPAPVPMPQDGYQALIEIRSGVRASIQPSEAATLLVAVRNLSPHQWNSSDYGTLRVGNHWLGEDRREMLIQDDGRAALRAVMQPGDVQELWLNVTAPGRPQHYTCQVDVVHEGVTWFGDRGSPTAQFDVVVGEAKREQKLRQIVEDQSESYPDIYADLEPSSDEPPAFPMFGVPIDVVMRLMSDGADVLLAENDERGGPEWVGYRYFVRKRSDRTGAI
jgi:SAM-dependent methyltransferase